MMAGRSFFPDGAYAAQDDYDGVGTHATSDAETTYNDTPRAGSVIAGLPEGAEDQDLNSQHNTHLPHSVLMLDVPPAAPALGRKPSTSDAAPDPSGGGGGGGGGGSDPTVSDASASDGLEEGLVPAICVTSTPDENLIVSSGLDPHPDQMVLGLDANGTEGVDLEVHSGTTDILLAVDVDLAPVLNSDHLDVGLTIGSDLNEVLGFDLRLSADGIFVGTDIDLSQVASAALTLDMAPSSMLTATANVIDVLGFDARMDVPGLAGVDAIGEASWQLAKGTLAEVTGIHLLGDSGSLTAQLMNNPDSAANTTVSNALGVLTSGSVDGVASEPAQPVAQIIFDASGLNQTGDVSSGDAIKLTAQTLSQPDELFSDNSYTDYHVTLQTQNLDGARITNTPNTSTIDSEALPSTTDAPHHPENLSSTTSPPSTIENVAPSAAIEQATESLAQSSTTLPHLTLY